jgi:hypothetical protein
MVGHVFFSGLGPMTDWRILGSSQIRIEIENSLYPSTSSNSLGRKNQSKYKYLIFTFLYFFGQENLEDTLKYLGEK